VTDLALRRHVPEVPAGGTKKPKRPRRVHVDHRVPLLVGVVGDARVPDVARIVDDDVEIAETLDAGGDSAIAEVLLRHVHRGTSRRRRH
jgi:hypothetical protein